MSTRRMKVLVMGGGIGGLTLARALLDAGLEVEVYEKRPLEQMLGGPGGIFIQRNAMRVYEVLDGGRLRERMYAQGGRVLDGGFFNSRGRPLYVNQPAFVGEPDLGVCLMRPELQRILCEALPEGTVRAGAALEDFTEGPEGVRARLRGGQEVLGDVLVGADGLHSRVRARLAGRERLEPPVYSGTSCWRGFFSAEGVPLDARYSWQELWGRGVRFGFFDVGGGRRSFYAFANLPPGGQDAPEGGARAHLRRLFKDFAAPVPAIIDRLEDETVYRDDVFDREPPGPQWGRGAVTLLGDAAHPSLPTLGQGGCMAIEDAFELARALRSAGPGPGVAQVLRAYEAGRSQRVGRVMGMSRQVARLAHAESPLACWMRDTIYRLTPARLGDLQFRWLFDYRPRW